MPIRTGKGKVMTTMTTQEKKVLKGLDTFTSNDIMKKLDISISSANKVINWHIQNKNAKLKERNNKSRIFQVTQ